jgi:hypothetical protein
VLTKATATAARHQIRMLVVVKESGSKPAHREARSPAGDSRRLVSMQWPKMRWVMCLYFVLVRHYVRSSDNVCPSKVHFAGNAR